MAKKSELEKFGTDMFDIAATNPTAAVIGIALLVGAGLFARLIPGAIGAIAPPLLWLFAVVATMGSLAGMVKYLDRQKRLDTCLTPEDLREMGWRDFEFLVTDTYRRLGYRGYPGEGTRDGGIDADLVGPSGARVLVQCKQYRTNRVSVMQVREFFGVMMHHGQDCRGIFVTCGSFTPDAVAFAKGKNLELVDGPRLMTKVLEANGGKMPEISPADASATPSCPRCGSTMVQRAGKNGQFWGCPSFPGCRGTRPI